MKYVFLLVLSLYSFVVFSKRGNLYSICGDSYPCSGLEDYTNLWVQILAYLDENSILAYDINNPKTRIKLNNMHYQGFLQSFIDKNNIKRQSLIIQTGKNKEFVKALLNFALFYPSIRRVFATSYLDQDLSFLPLSISYFSAERVDAGKLGVWQLGLDIWKKYFHSVPSYVRIDPVFSSFVAVKYLADLYREFLSYPLSITGFVVGDSVLEKAIKEQKTKNVKLLSYSLVDNNLRALFRTVYPKFLATRFLARKELTLYESNSSRYSFVVFAKKLKRQDLFDLKLNPVVSSLGFVPRLYPVRVRRGTELKLINLLQYSKKTKHYYKVKQGDNLIYIARKFAIAVRKLRELNKLKNDKIIVGQKIIVSTEKKPVIDRVYNLLGIERWRPLYTELLKYNKTIYFVSDRVYTYDKSNVYVFDNALLPQISKPNTCTIDVFKKIGLFDVYFYDRERKFGIVYLAPWESIETLSKFIAYDIRRENNIPIWLNSLSYKAVKVNFNKVKPKAFTQKRMALLKSMMKQDLSKFNFASVENIQMSEYYKNARYYPSYLLLCYNPKLFSVDLESLKTISLPKRIISGQSF